MISVENIRDFYFSIPGFRFGIYASRCAKDIAVIGVYYCISTKILEITGTIFLAVQIFVHKPL